MARQHDFQCEGMWTGQLLQGMGALKVGSIDTEFAVPANMGGSGRGSNPEELMLAAAHSCYLMTLAATLQGEGVAFTQLKGVSRATFAMTPAGPVMTKLQHDPVVYISPKLLDVMRGSIQSCFAFAERSCTISKAISGNVEVAVSGRVEALSPEAK